MQMKLASTAQALVVAAGLALAPVAAFAQTSPAAKPAHPQTAEAACAVHKKDSKEFKECAEKHKAAAPKTETKDPAKKS